jgi:hypothetical protein
LTVGRAAGAADRQVITVSAHRKASVPSGPAAPNTPPAATTPPTPGRRTVMRRLLQRLVNRLLQRLVDRLVLPR